MNQTKQKYQKYQKETKENERKRKLDLALKKTEELYGKALRKLAK